MTKNLHAPTRLLLSGLLLAAIAAPAGARVTPRSEAARARQALRARGFRQVQVSCSRRLRCHWSAVRRGRECTGRASGAHIRISKVRCSLPHVTREPLLFGFNTYTTKATVAEQLATGATVTRLFIPWWQIEPLQGVWQWAQIDQQYQQLLAAGLRPLLVPYGSPCWAAKSCSSLFAVPPRTAEDGAWTAFVRAATARYPRAVGVEVWNEPNLASAFYPQANPKRYTELLKEAYIAVKSVDPAMPVISGGLAMDDGAGTAGPGYASRTFLADMYADGAAQWMDGVAIHVYPTDTRSDGTLVWDAAALPRWLEQVRDIQRAQAVSETPIWITEMGVSTTTEPGFPTAVSEQDQSRDLVSMLQTARSDPGVRMAIIDTLQDASPNLLEDLVSDLVGPVLNYDVFYNQVIEGLGIFHTDWSPKPAACAISAIIGGTLHC
jgi:hypothetical protein